MYDVVILGSGPAGLTGAIYGKRAELKLCVLEKEYLGTGQIAESARVENYPGLYGESGYDLGEKFRLHAQALGVEPIEAMVTSITPLEPHGWRLASSQGQTYETQTILYAAGATHRKLGVPGEAEFFGKGVSACATCDGAFYRGKTVAVIGGGDTAFEDALYLSRLAKQVYLVHRRAGFRANPQVQSEVFATENIQVITPAVATHIIGDTHVTALELEVNGVTESLPIDGVFVAIGADPNTALVRDYVQLDPAGYIIAGEDGKTSAPGIFAAGDVRTKTLRQVVTAAADGANSIASITSYLAEMEGQF